MLNGSNPAIGLDERLEYKAVSCLLEEMDTIVIHSDGITESRMPDGSIVGQKRFLDLVRRNGRLSPDSVIDEFLAGLTSPANPFTLLERG